jgi:OHS family lactose permease-like MFS transporter
MNNKTEYYKISSFIFLYFFTWSASIGLLAIWLGQKANLSGSVIGTVFAVNGIFSVILKPIYGYILDKIGMSKYLLYFVVAMSALMAPFFIYVYQPLLMSNTMLGIIIGALYLSFAWYAGVAACESYSDRFSRLNGMEFGQIRMWGSLGWAVASSFSGLLFNLSPAYNFIMGSVASVIMLIVLLSLKEH